MSDVEEKKKRTPVKRWIILALVLLGAYCAYIGPTILKPVAPVVALPAEPTGLSILGFQITNTILSTLIADLILILIALVSVRGFVRSGKLAPGGFYNAFEALVEYMWNTVEGTVGKWAKNIFPWVATIFLIVFVANMVKLVPGFESIGYLKEAHKSPAYAPVKLAQLGGLGVYTVDKGQPVEVAHEEAGHEAEGEASHAAEGEPPCHACEVVPFLRGSATDLNFTIALAIIAVVMSQVIGVQALGPGYFEKFFQFRRMISGGIFGLIDFAVGFLELILEFAKVLSFSFRLFGNIFAGALLLSILGTLLPIILPPGLYLFEIFFGAIQAYVFFLLAMVFMNMATVGHGGDHHEEAH
ncbi:MAG: F0F1 ATP synthase subunit A [Anaerolineales bacterium]|nr:F0F1 ATP synthase subunit A [Anaerolineales bacterium]